MGRGMGSHQASFPKTESWITPKALIDALGGWESFDLDPCASVDQPWPTAKTMWTEGGLDYEREDREWQGAGRIWLNPPYTRGVVGKWLERLAEGAAQDLCEGVALVFARTETKEWREQVWMGASGICFLFGRLYFHYPDGTRAAANAGAPSALIAYGRREALRLRGLVEDNELLGTYVENWSISP